MGRHCERTTVWLGIRQLEPVKRHDWAHGTTGQQCDVWTSGRTPAIECQWLAGIEGYRPLFEIIGSGGVMESLGVRTTGHCARLEEMIVDPVPQQTGAILRG